MLMFRWLGFTFILLKNKDVEFKATFDRKRDITGEEG